MKTVRSENLTGFEGRIGGRAFEAGYQLTKELWGDEPSVPRKLWGLVLLLAIEDKATSVHYHPGRPDGELAYIVDNVRYEMVPPPVHLAKPLIAAARSLIEPAWGIIGRFAAHHNRTVSGSFILDVSGERYEWDMVCWSVGPRIGAEFYRAFPPVDLDPIRI